MKEKELSPEEHIKIRQGGYKSFLRRHENESHKPIEDIDEKIYKEQIGRIQKKREIEKGRKEIEIKIKKRTGKFFKIIGLILFILFLIFMFIMQWYGLEFAY